MPRAQGGAEGRVCDAFVHAGRCCEVDTVTVDGYTRSMKTAVSIPDDVFNEAEILAKELNTSRSDVYARALAAFVGDHSSDRVTEALDEALAAVGEPVDPAIAAAGRRILSDIEW